MSKLDKLLYGGFAAVALAGIVALLVSVFSPQKQLAEEETVDTATEKLIQQALERLLTGRTAIVIAHRLSTIRNAHQILVMNQGRIIERGNHHSLLQQKGVYAQLARIQNTTFIEEKFQKLSL